MVAAGFVQPGIGAGVTGFGGTIPPPLDHVSVSSSYSDVSFASSGVGPSNSNEGLEYTSLS